MTRTLLLTLWIGIASAQQERCNKYGGSMVTWNEGCYARGYTFSEQCNVQETVEGGCQVTANSCGCHIYYPGGGISSVGSGSNGCDNACVDVTSDIPEVEGHMCAASASAMSFEGRCDSRGYTYTPQCNFQEIEQGGLTTCYITANSCGCLYWENGVDATWLGGVTSNRNCDPCNPALRSSTTSVGTGFALLSFAAVLAFLL